MRKADLEMLEVRLEPLQTARDRLEADLGEMRRALREVVDQVKDLQRNEQTHATEIAQGLASIRSLLQRANRAAREQGIIEDEPPIDEPGEPVNVESHHDHALSRARTANPGRKVL